MVTGMAARKSHLSTVPAGSRSKTTVTSVSQAVADGTRRDQLAQLRARIARAIDEPNIRGADLAALSRRLLEVGREIEAIDAAHEQEATESDEVADETLDTEAL